MATMLVKVLSRTRAPGSTSDASRAATAPPRLRPCSTIISGGTPFSVTAQSHSARASRASPSSDGLPSEPGYPRTATVAKSQPSWVASRMSGLGEATVSAFPWK